MKLVNTFPLSEDAKEKIKNPTLEKWHIRILSEEEEQLVLKYRKTKEEMQKRYDEVQELRKNCNHNWYYEGHGHNYNCFICVYCGKQEER